MSNIDDRILKMLRQVCILSPESVRIGEREQHGLQDCLIPWLQCEIYKNFFCHMQPVSAPASVPLLVRALAAANAGVGTAQPAWYMAHGRPEPPATKWLRFYWHVSSQGAPVLLGLATEILNRLQVPFRLKILLDTSMDRQDAAVLYLPLNRWIVARDFVEAISRQLENLSALHPAIPLFAKLVRPGVGLAEDPQTGVSFGLHRSGLVARALARSYLAGHAGEAQRARMHAARQQRELANSSGGALQPCPFCACSPETQQWSALSAEFAREGLSIDRPYLNAASRDAYEF